MAFALNHKFHHLLALNDESIFSIRELILRSVYSLFSYSIKSRILAKHLEKEKNREARLVIKII